MKELLLAGYPVHTALLPVICFAGAFILSKILGFRFWISFLLACVPLSLPFFNLPFSRDIQENQPLLLVGAGFALLLLVAFVRALLRPIVSPIGFLSDASSLKLFARVLTIAALVFVSVLLYKRELIEQFLPVGWKGGLGIVFLSVSILTACFSLFRILSSTVVFILWSAVSLVIASEVFLSKLPHELVREDLREILSLMPKNPVTEKISEYAASAQDAFKLAIIGGTGIAKLSKDGLAETFSDVFSENVKNKKVHVQDLAKEGVTALEAQRIAYQLGVGYKPDVVVLGGWSDDNEAAGKFTDVEKEAIYRQNESLARFPMLPEILSSRLYQYIFGSSTLSQESLPLLKKRVPVSDYKKALSETIQGMRDGNVQVILLSEPFDSARAGQSSEYLFAMRDVASAEGVPLVEPENLTRKVTALPIFVGPHEVTKYGQKLIAQQVAKVSGSLNLDKPDDVVGSKNFIVPTSIIGSDLLFKAVPQFKGSRFYHVLFSVNGKYVDDRRFTDDASVRARFTLPAEYRKVPGVRLKVEARAIGSEKIEKVMFDELQVGETVINE